MFMPQNYFIVFELPVEPEFLFNESVESSEHFWTEAKKAINSGDAKMISCRKDTGVSEDLRKHVSKIAAFTTFVLVTMPLNKVKSASKIYKKASKSMISPAQVNVIDKAHNFQLVTMDC
jgi:uncharacterized protein (DUF1919 family)